MEIVADWSTVEFCRPRKSGRPLIFLPLVNELLLLWDAVSCVLAAFIGQTAVQMNIKLTLPLSSSGLWQIIILTASLVFVVTLRNMKPPELAIEATPSHIALTGLRRFIVVFASVTYFVYRSTGANYCTDFGLLCWTVCYIICLVVSRTAVCRWLCRLRRLGKLRKSVALICGNEKRALLAARLNECAEIVQTFEFKTQQKLSSDDLEQLIELGKYGAVDAVLVAADATNRSLAMSLANNLQILPIEIAIYESERLFTHSLLRNNSALGEMPITVVANQPISRRDFLIKTIAEKVVSALLLIILSPLFIIIAFSIRLTSKGTVFFRQERQGWCGKEFLIFKFRTMHDPSDGTIWSTQTSRNDARCTKFGSFLRRTSLDELPQLLNVLRGEMSLVGPRPHARHLHEFERNSQEIIADYAKRNRVKPGITGWAQIHGARGATITADQMRLRIAYDLFYIENWSLWLDIRILIRTPICLIGENVY